MTKLPTFQVYTSAPSLVFICQEKGITQERCNLRYYRMLQIPHLLICWIFRFCFILLDMCVISSLCVSCDLNFSFRVVRRFLQNGCLCVIHLNISIMNFNLIDKVFRVSDVYIIFLPITSSVINTFRLLGQNKGENRVYFVLFFITIVALGLILKLPLGVAADRHAIYVINIALLILTDIA